VQKNLLNTSVMPGAPYTRYGDAVDAVLHLSTGVGFKLLPWLGGVSSSYIHREQTGEAPSHEARQPVHIAEQRKALSLLLRLLRPKAAGLLPPDEALPFLVKHGFQPVDTIVSFDIDSRVRQMTEDLLNNLLSPYRLRRVYAQEQLGAGSLPLTTFEMLAAIVSSIMGSAELTSVPASDWDLQRLLIRNLGTAYNSGVLPERVEGAILRHLRLIHKTLHVAVNKVPNDFTEDSPGAGSLLLEHLLALQHQLRTAVCSGHLDHGNSCEALELNVESAATEGRIRGGNLVGLLFLSALSLQSIFAL